MADVRTLLGQERGSLPMAMLAVIIVGGLVTILTTSMVVGQRQSRFDQGYEQSLQVAEVGLDRLVALVESREIEQMPELETGNVVTRSGEAQGGKWRADAEWDPLTGTWTITSTGQAPLGQVRTAQMQILVRSLFEVGAFGKFFADFNGDNWIDSYRSGRSVVDEGGDMTFDASLGDSRLCRGSSMPSEVRVPQVQPPHSQDIAMCDPQGMGVVATNGRLFIKGQTFNQIDGWAEIHYAKENVVDPLPNASGYCQGVPLVCGSFVAGDPDSKLKYYREELVLPYDPVVPPAQPTGSFNGRSTWACDGDPVAGRGCLGPGTHVLTDVTLFTDCDLLGQGATDCTEIRGTPDDPTIVFLVGMLKIPSREVVNFHMVDGFPEPKPSSGLLIFSSGTGPAMDFRNYAAISAGIYAPNGAATGGAQVNIFGALIAGSINNNGGWSFHYDVALADVNIQAPLLARNWVEVRDHLEIEDEAG